MLKVRVPFVVCFVVLLSCAAAFAQEKPIDFSSKSARVFRNSRNAPLTLSSRQGQLEIISSFLQSRGKGKSAVDALVVRKERFVERTGVTHVQLEQRVAGMEVYGTYVKASLNQQGQIVSLIENLPGAVPAIILSAQITEREALDAALKRHYPDLSLAPVETERRGDRVTFSKGDSFSEDLTVTRVIVPMADSSMQEGYLVVTWDRNNVLRHTLVGRNGDILDVELRTNNDSYNIFPNHPGITGQQTLVSFPGGSGWVFSNTTTGNNVDAYLDRDNNNAPDVNGRPISSTQDFVTTANMNDSPTTADNQKVAVQNLFYLNNVIHDKLYQHGFTEAAGNFQEDNFVNGGAGSDSVSAEAQDGGGTNNANFATPADGGNPRMQMYLWTTATPNRDGDLDSDIVWHEYGHGLTWRMIGGMSGPLAGAIGEGMGDALAILINNHDRVAEYSKNNLVGIRRFPYTNYPNTYGDVTGASVHNDGEIYGATVWRLWELWQQNGLSQELLFDYLIDGMDFTPSRPAYEDMRDGILAAVTDQSHECLVWDAFAHFGIGVGADGRESCFGPFCSVSITESFQKPAACTGAPQPPAAPSNLTANAVSASQINLSWTDNSGDETGFKIARCTDTDCSNFSQIAVVSADVISFSDTGLSASTTYSYRVFATNAAGSSTASNTANATTQAPPSSPPAAPTNLVATAISASRIDLSWTDGSADEDGFKIERSTDGVNYAQIGTVELNVTTLSDTGLQRNKTYYYRVRSYRETLNSAYSNVASAKTLKR